MQTGTEVWLIVLAIDRAVRKQKQIGGKTTKCRQGPQSYVMVASTSNSVIMCALQFHVFHGTQHVGLDVGLIQCIKKSAEPSKLERVRSPSINAFIISIISIISIIIISPSLDDQIIGSSRSGDPQKDRAILSLGGELTAHRLPQSATGRLTFWHTSKINENQ